MKNILFFTSIILFCSSCSNDFKHPDTSKIDLQVRIDPFYQELFSRQDSDLPSKIARLNTKYGDYFTTYCENELRIGNPNDSLFVREFERFYTMKENAEVIATCDSVYNNLSTIDDKLTDAFRCFAYYFPNISTPQVYMHFSGFNNKMFVDSTYLSLSIEHYLGCDCRYYPMLEIPQYARTTKDPDFIVSDLVKAWLYANFPNESNSETVLDALIYQGKIIYALRKCIPDLKEENAFGYTPEELKWCKSYERQMWASLAEQKLLYSTNPLDRLKLVNDAPFTTFFGQSSPGRAAIYCATNIVISYHHQHPELSLEDLLKLHDAEEIMLGAHYRP